MKLPKWRLTGVCAYVQTRAWVYGVILVNLGSSLIYLAVYKRIDSRRALLISYMGVYKLRRLNVGEKQNRKRS